jgi:tetratricopeptide (TPR) repeat protein
LFGLLLFEAEESLARGAAEKALVLGSKAVKERPDSLTARSLLERARGEMLRGRRREKLEARVVEARGLVEGGNWLAAERIVTSALKLVPDHPVALELFGKIRDLKLRPGTAEAEAEGELLLLARAQAQKAAEAARAALAAGWNRQAFLHIRRGLRQVPDHPDLLALLHETQGSLEQLGAERARRRALLSQVRAGLDLLQTGDEAGSLRILRAVLAEDPDNARAQAAIQEVRKAHLERAAPPAPPPAPAAAPAVPTPRPVAPRPPPPRPAAMPASGPSRIPVEILLPRTRRRATPAGVILLGAVVLLGVLVVVVGRSGHAPPQAPATPPPSAAPPSLAEVAPTTLPGPLTDLDPGLRTAVESTLADYARALERADPLLLAAARPDLSAQEREARRAPFVGALNAAADLRVIDVSIQGNEASVTVLSTDVIVVKGREGSSGPTEENLRFVRRGGTWSLRERRAGRP